MKKRAFTLIELLVVIAIIAILAAILFPVFAQAKAAAKKAVAISNVKEITLGGIMYSSDYDDIYVPYFSSVVYKGGSYYYYNPQQYWPSLLSPYIQKAMNANGRSQPLDDQISKIFFDPIETYKSQVGDPNCAYGNVSSWGLSDDVAQWWAPPGIQGAGVGHTTSMTAAASPGTLITFAETYDWLCGENYPGSSLALSYFDRLAGPKYDGADVTLNAPYNSSYIKTSFTQPADPAGGNNVGFFDGHVQTMHFGQIAGTLGAPFNANVAAYWSVTGNGLWP